MSQNVILLTDQGIGTTQENALKEQLLLAWLYTQCNLEAADLPSHIILYTDAVKLTLKDTQSTTHFQELIQKKVDVVICGACLDYFKISKKDLRFGRISNMYEIVEIMNQAKNVIRP